MDRFIRTEKRNTMVGYRQRLFLLTMLLCSETAAFAASEGLTGKPAAQCLLGNIDGEGHLFPDAFGAKQVLVPQYEGTSGCAEDGCSGPRSQVAAVLPSKSWGGRAQLGSDEQGQQVLKMQRNQSSVEVTNTPPILTAGEVAENTESPPQTEETCTEIEMCIEQQKLPRTFECVDCTPFVDLGCTETGPACLEEVNGVCTQPGPAISCPLDPACTKIGIVKQCVSCGAPGSLVPFCTDLSSPPNEPFNEHATYLGVMEEANRLGSRYHGAVSRGALSSFLPARSTHDFSAQSDSASHISRHYRDQYPPSQVLR